MEVLLIPLAKGIVTLFGSSSLLFFGVRKEIEIQVQEDAVEAELRFEELKNKEAELKKMEDLKPFQPKVKPKDLQLKE